MRERIPMGGAAQMMRAHDAKMQQGYGGAMMMHQGMGVHRGMPYIAAQPPCSPFGAMDAGGTENVPPPPSQLALQSGRMPHQSQHSPCLGICLYVCVYIRRYARMCVCVCVCVCARAR